MIFRAFSAGAWASSRGPVTPKGGQTKGGLTLQTPRGGWGGILRAGFDMIHVSFDRIHVNFDGTYVSFDGTYVKPGLGGAGLA